jgi:hypothetical protein
MPRFTLHEARAPHRRLVEVEATADPQDEEECVALLRRLARQHRRKPADVILRWSEGRRVREYHD